MALSDRIMPFRLMDFHNGYPSIEGIRAAFVDFNSQPPLIDKPSLLTPLDIITE